jgi:hypothetical protein
VGGLSVTSDVGVATTRSADLTARAAWTLVWLAVTTSGVAAWSEWTAWPGYAVVAPALILGGVLGGALTWAVRDPARASWRHGAVAAVLASVLADRGLGIAARTYYATDAAAFNDVAARALLHGRDPYTTSMAPAARLLDHASGYWTYTLNGSHVHAVSYPAGSFLLQAPLVALGLRHLPTDWIDLVAWLATGVILARLLPRHLTWLAALLVLSSAYVGTFANGGTDALFVPFLVLALWRWDRTLDPGAGVVRWVSPVALGVACSIKQTPWFVVPFVLVALAVEARAAHRACVAPLARYAGLTLGTFLLINLPFVVWNPGAWLRGVLLPLRDPLVPDGQGLVTLALHGMTGGVVLHGLWLSGALVLVAGLVALVAWYPALKRIWPLLVPIALFVPGRSLTSYLLDFLPAALAAALSVRDAPPDWRAPLARARIVVLAGVLIGAGVAAGEALTSAPLALSVTGVTTRDAHQRLTAVIVTLTNLSSQTVHPHFMVDLGGPHPNGFWRVRVLHGSLPLRAGRHALVALSPVAWTWAPAHDQYWIVDAYSASPAALSTSPLQRWTLATP